MTGWEFYSELKGWQTVIGSVLGFGALIGGALFNAHLNRKRDDYIRNAEAITVALSLYGEINLLRRAIAALANGLGSWFDRRGYHNPEVPEYFKELYALHEPSIFTALAPKLGLLHPDILISVTKFYADYGAAKDNFPKLFESEESSLSYGIEWVSGPAIDAVDDIEGAIQQIERIGNIKEPVETPKTDKAKKAVKLADELMPEDG